MGLAVLAVLALALAAHSSVHTACKTISASFLATSVLIPLLVGSCRLLAGYLQTQDRPRAVENILIGRQEARSCTTYDHDDGRQEVVTVLRRHRDLLLKDVCTTMLLSLDWELQTAGCPNGRWTGRQPWKNATSWMATPLGELPNGSRERSPCTSMGLPGSVRQSRCANSTMICAPSKTATCIPTGTKSMYIFFQIIMPVCFCSERENKIAHKKQEASSSFFVGGGVEVEL